MQRMTLSFNIVLCMWNPELISRYDEEISNVLELCSRNIYIYLPVCNQI